MKCVSKEIFENESRIRITNILEGFDNYSSGIIKSDTYEDLNEFLKACYRESRRTIIDYYGNGLEDSFFSNIMNNLNKDEELLITSVKSKFDKECIYFEDFKLEELELINKLSINSILFSTYNFIEDEVVIWSNYDKRFPIFFKNNNMIKKYKDISENYNVEIIEFKLI